MNLVPRIHRLTDKEKNYLIWLLSKHGNYHAGNLPFASAVLIQILLERRMIAIHTSPFGIGTTEEQNIKKITAKLEIEFKDRTHGLSVRYNKSKNDMADSFASQYLNADWMKK